LGVVSEQEDKGRKFWQVDKLLELGGVQFVDDKKAEQGAAIEGIGGLFEEE